MRSINTKDSSINDALKLLQIDHLAFAIHDQSFPSTDNEEIGRGSPYSDGGWELLKFVRDLGFNIIQFGPQGKTSKSDISPYNSTAFTRNLLSISFSLLARTNPELFVLDDLKHVTSKLIQSYDLNRMRVNNSTAWNTVYWVMDVVFDRYYRTKGNKSAFFDEFSLYKEKLNDYSVNWVERDSLYEILTDEYRTDDWWQWNRSNDRNIFTSFDSSSFKDTARISELSNKCSRVIEQFLFGQFLLEKQHGVRRREAKQIGLKFYGDLQIGYSHQDIWAWKSLFLPGYLLGAPPSRSNPEGQPWGYPILNPDLYYSYNKGMVESGPALQLLRARLDRMFDLYDGIRIDHPHGLVCPWVYKSSELDPFSAVQQGTRLFSSPNVPGHEELKKYSIINEDQVNHDPHCPRYADNWESFLTQEQIDKYAIVIDLILESAQKRGVNKSDILCEVLSTWPFPLKKVMVQRGIGRFCVTQKADPYNSADVYRRENTGPDDWIMVGNHDTKPLRLFVEEKFGSEWYAARAKVLSEELAHSDVERSKMYQSIIGNPSRFRDAMVAELFLGPSKNVMIFFADLFGMEEIYNRPGIIDDKNWTLRVPCDFRSFYNRKIASDEAIDLRRCMAIALRSRFSQSNDAVGLAQKLYPIETEERSF